MASLGDVVSGDEGEEDDFPLSSPPPPPSTLSQPGSSTARAPTVFAHDAFLSDETAAALAPPPPPPPRSPSKPSGGLKSLGEDEEPTDEGESETENRANSGNKPRGAPPRSVAKTRVAQTLQYCVRARELLVSLKKSDWLPPWDEQSVSYILYEIKLLHDKIIALTSQLSPERMREPATVAALTTMYRCVERNKRCLLIYTQTRVDRIENLYWETAGSPIIPGHLIDKLSPAEVDHYASFHSCMSEYCAATQVVVAQDVQPPKEIFVKVRVLQQDAGKVIGASGNEMHFFDKGTYFLKRADVEPLILRNVLEQVP